MSYCPICGSEVVLMENSDFYCAACDMYLAPNAVENQPIPTMLSLMSGRKELPGEGCRACGNPVYPSCMDACPLFDN
ncbi:MAG: hypothetical protein IJH53_06090 [Oscillospiraceae bacterium]|nr:hypothetical protein [Oscillospiraceae bacterium]